MIDLKELKKMKKRNFEERLKFVDLWCEYIKTRRIEYGALNKQN